MLSNGIKRTAFCFCFIIFLLVSAVCMASEAADLTAQCRITVTENPDKRRNMLNSDMKRSWNGGERGEILVTTPKGQKAQGVQVGLYGHDTALIALNAEGTVIARTKDAFRVQYLAFSEPCGSFTIRRADGSEPFQVAFLQVVGEGPLPRWVQRWEKPDRDIDLMLISTHPDDEILWFGGLLPTYAGELKKKVLVVYMVGGQTPHRVLELLDGLWTMGVTLYPDIGSLKDTRKATIPSTLLVWGRDTAARRVTEAIRRYRPKVVVTQDVRGEYGHPHHVITVEAVMDVAAGKTADPEIFPESAKEYGVWQAHKVYIHLYKKGAIRMDWRKPLSAFGGQTGIEVARAAFKKHRSQQGRYRVRDEGQYDSSLFGLYYTDVGEDIQGKDLFEHIPENET